MMKTLKDNYIAEQKARIAKFLLTISVAVFAFVYALMVLVFTLSFYPEKTQFSEFLSSNIKPEDVRLFLGIIIAFMSLAYKIISDRIKKREEHQEWLLRNKNAILIEIVDLLTSGLGSTKNIGRRELDRRLKNINPALIAHGSNELLKTFGAFRKSKGQQNTDEIIKTGERLLRIIRAELGLDDSKMLPGGVLSSILGESGKQFAFEICKDEKYSDIRPNRDSSQEPPSPDGFSFP